MTAIQPSTQSRCVMKARTSQAHERAGFAKAMADAGVSADKGEKLASPDRRLLQAAAASPAESTAMVGPISKPSGVKAAKPSSLTNPPVDKSRSVRRRKPEMRGRREAARASFEIGDLPTGGGAAFPQTTTQSALAFSVSIGSPMQAPPPAASSANGASDEPSSRIGRPGCPIRAGLETEMRATARPDDNSDLVAPAPPDKQSEAVIRHDSANPGAVAPAMPTPVMSAPRLNEPADKVSTELRPTGSRLPAPFASRAIGDAFHPPIAHLELADLARAPDQQGDMSIRMSLPHLGVVEVRFGRRAGSAAAMTISVDHPETLRTMVSDQAQLRSALHDSGLHETDKTIEYLLLPSRDTSGSATEPAFSDERRRSSGSAGDLDREPLPGLEEQSPSTTLHVAPCASQLTFGAIDITA